MNPRLLPMILLTLLCSCGPVQRDVAFRDAAAIGQLSKEDNSWLCHRLSVEGTAMVSILLPNGQYVPIQQLNQKLLEPLDITSTSAETRAIAWRMPDSTGNRWVVGWERVEESGWSQSDRALGRYIITFDGRRVRQVELVVHSTEPDEKLKNVPVPTLSTVPPGTAYPMPLTETQLSTLFGPVLQRRDYRNQ